MQNRACRCMMAQAKIARLAGTLPVHETFESVVEEVAAKLKDSKASTGNVCDELAKRGVRLPWAVQPTPNTSVSAAEASTFSYASSSTCMGSPVIVFLCDIEGTTTPLPFVRQVMLPIAAQHVDAYAKTHFPGNEAFVKSVASAAAAVAAAAHGASPPAARTPQDDAPRESTLSLVLEGSRAANFKDENANEEVRTRFCEHFKAEMEKGSTAPYIKEVQGAIWEEVFAQGHHQTQVFPDVNEFFRFVGGEVIEPRCHIAIYSTGSVAAQKLVMRHTPFGDLNPFITSYFDPTVVGSKLTPKSYMRIRHLLLKELGMESPEQLKIVFLTDSTSEASAADTSDAIDCPILCIRPLNAWVSCDTIFSVSVPFVTSFTQFLRPDEPVDYEQLVRDTKASLEVKEAP